MCSVTCGYNYACLYATGIKTPVSITELRSDQRFTIIVLDETLQRV